MVLKTVRTNNASGNNLRLYADFLSPNGTPYRRDVLIGNPNSVFGDQSTPQVAALDMGRYAIAWRTTACRGAPTFAMPSWTHLVAAPHLMA